MPTNKPKYYWHIHHEILCEGTYDISERIGYIKKYKRDIRTRLHLMTPVKHPEKLPLRFRRAATACVKADAAYENASASATKAYDIHTKALSAAIAFDAYTETLADYVKVFAVYEQARAACAKASITYIKALTTCAAQLEKLHKKEHPNCPWNGKTIFPKRQ